MDEITYDKVEDEKNPEVKQLYWNIAFGLQEVDGYRRLHRSEGLCIPYPDGRDICPRQGNNPSEQEPEAVANSEIQGRCGLRQVR